MFFDLLRAPWVGLQCVVEVFPDHTYLLFYSILRLICYSHLQLLIIYFVSIKIPKKRYYKCNPFEHSLYELHCFNRQASKPCESPWGSRYSEPHGWQKALFWKWRQHIWDICLENNVEVRRCMIRRNRVMRQQLSASFITTCAVRMGHLTAAT